MPEQVNAQISPNDNLLRRVPFHAFDYIKPDGSISSLSFKPKQGEDGLSVNIERLTSYEASILDVEKFRLALVTVELVRSLKLKCEPDPKPDNQAHALIKGTFSKSICRKLAKEATKIPFPDKW